MIKGITLSSLSLILGALLLLPSCLEEKKEATPLFVVVNVLAKDIYDDCHIKGSINVPYEDFKEYATLHWNPATTKVIVYCANPQCTASIEGAKTLVNELGFNKNNVWAYEGGTAAALYDKLPVEGPCKEAYLTEYQPTKFEKEVDGIQIISSAELRKMIEEFAHR